MKVTGGVYVGWRMFGYEYDPTSAANVAYNVYRDGTKLATVTDSTNYLDASGTASSTYTVRRGDRRDRVRAVADGATVWAQNYLRIPLDAAGDAANGGTYSANDASVGDLDGDGKLRHRPQVGSLELEGQLAVRLHRRTSSSTPTRWPARGCGASISGRTSAPARTTRSSRCTTSTATARPRWRARPRRAPRTAPARTCSTGPAASDDDSASYRNSDGYVLTGPEYLTVFDGRDRQGAGDGELSRAARHGVELGRQLRQPRRSLQRRRRLRSDTGSGKTATGRPASSCSAATTRA